MSWVSIQTVTGKGKSYRFEMESDGIYNMNIPTGKILLSANKILQICITEDLLVIRWEDRDFRTGRQSASWLKNNREINNVDAYDHDGNHLWNIGSIIGDIKMQIDSVYHITAEQAMNEYGIEVQKDQNNLFSCTAGGFLMIIDGTQRKLLVKKAGMVR